MQYNPSRYEVDKKTGFFTIGYGAGSSPTFTNLTVTGTALFADGSAAAPSIAFAADNDTGFYRSGSGNIRFSSNGVDAVQFSNTGTTFMPGGINAGYIANAGPSGGLALYALGTNQNITLTPSGTGQISIPAGANATPTLTTTGSGRPNTGLAFGGSDAGPETIQFVYRGTPSWAFFSSTNLYHPGSGTITTDGNTSFRTGPGSANLHIYLPAASSNVLIGGLALDGGNGALQLATHSSNTGGIGFGTDTSLYRSAAGILNLAQPTGVNSELWFETNSANKGKIVVTNSGTMALVSNGTTALTLDSTQRGLFVGDVILNKIGSDPMLYSGGGRGLMIGTNAGAVAITLDSSQRMLTTGMAAFGGTTFLNATQWTAGSSGFGANGFDKTVIGYLKSSTNGATIAGHSEYLSAWANLNLAANNLYFRTNGETIALTITNTQVATFAAGVDVGAASYLAFTNRSAIRSSADGLIRLTNWSDTDFTRLQFGGTTASFPALERSGANVRVRVADGSADSSIVALTLLASGAAVTAGAGAISYGGTTATTATAGAQTLPANPAGFIIVNIAGTTAKIPYYAN